MFCSKKEFRKDSIIETFKWYFKLGESFKTPILLNILIGILLILINLLFVTFTKLCIDIATNNNTSLSLNYSFLLIIILIIAEIALTFISKRVQSSLEIKIQNRLQYILFTHILKSQDQATKNYHSGDLLNRLEGDVGCAQSFITQHLPSFIITSLQFIGALIYLFFMNKELALTLVIIIPFFILISKSYFLRMHPLTQKIKRDDSLIEATFQESIQNSTILKVLRVINIAVSKLNILHKSLQYEIKEETKITSILSTIINIGFSIGYLVTFIWGVYQLNDHIITYGVLIAYLQLISLIEDPIHELSKFLFITIKAQTSSKRLIELENMKLEDLSSNRILKGPIGLNLNKISFSYTDAIPILKDITLNIPPASKVAIVGDTGIGKTTLLRLFLALRKTTEGTISLVSDHKKIPLSPSLRCNMAYVPQEESLFSGTIKENLLLGNSKAKAKNIKEALNVASANFVYKLNNGLLTTCGEKGEGLSKGQAQRIAISRAILMNKNILILDEVTSALDEDTGKQVIKKIIKNKDQTLLCITHRKDLLQYFTHILEIRSYDEVSFKLSSKKKQ